MGSSGLFPYPGRTCIAGLGDESRVDVDGNLEWNIHATQTEYDSIECSKKGGIHIEANSSTLHTGKVLQELFTIIWPTPFSQEYRYNITCRPKHWASLWPWLAWFLEISCSGFYLPGNRTNLPWHTIQICRNIAEEVASGREGTSQGSRAARWSRLFQASQHCHMPQWTLNLSIIAHVSDLRTLKSCDENELTSRFFRDAQKLVPRRLVPLAEQRLVPFRKVECRNDKLGQILSVCERHGIVSCARYSRCLVGHVNTKHN